jgi:hypothetical protein
MDAYKSGETMTDAIALSSPSGRMSKRARNAALARLGSALFSGYTPAPRPVESERDNCLRRAKDFRDMAARGMKPRAFLKEALRLEARAAELAYDLPRP